GVAAGRGARVRGRGVAAGGAAAAVTGALAIWVILPVHDEAETLPILWREVAEVLPALADSAEVIFVDDGSTDGSADVIRSLARQDPRIRLLRFEKNAGLSAAFHAGFQAARGRIVATLDSDLQNDPHDLPALVARLDEADAAVGARLIRHDSLVKRLSSRIAN